jgi:hypothetical protein
MRIKSGFYAKEFIQNCKHYIVKAIMMMVMKKEKVMIMTLITQGQGKACFHKSNIGRLIHRKFPKQSISSLQNYNIAHIIINCN